RLFPKLRDIPPQSAVSAHLRGNNVMQFTDFPRCGTPRLAARKNCAYGKKAPRRAVGKVPYEGAQHTALQQARLLGVAVSRHRVFTTSRLEPRTSRSSRRLSPQSCGALRSIATAAERIARGCMGRRNGLSGSASFESQLQGSEDP